MLDQDFFDFLEYEICKAFNISDNEDVKGLWCDGLLRSDLDEFYTQKFVNDNRWVMLKAFIVKDNSVTEYLLTLKFGRKSLSRYARNLEIITCVPDTKDPNWLKIDTKYGWLEIQLD